MATWPARTWTPGETDSDVWMNAVRDELNELHAQSAGPNAGIWVPVPFNAANWSANTGAWTMTSAQILINAYTVIRKTVIWTQSVGGTLTAAPTTLGLTPPLPFAKSYNNTRASFAIANAVYQAEAYGYSTAGGVLNFLCTPQGTTWPAGPITLAFTLVYETP
jgi:hypothetical protein